MPFLGFGPPLGLDVLFVTRDGVIFLFLADELFACNVLLTSARLFEQWSVMPR